MRECSVLNEEFNCFNHKHSIQTLSSTHLPRVMSRINEIKYSLKSFAVTLEMVTRVEKSCQKKQKPYTNGVTQFPLLTKSLRAFNARGKPFISTVILSHTSLQLKFRHYLIN